MRNILYLLTLILIFNTASLWANTNNQINKIRKLYNQAEELNKLTYSHHEVTLNTMLPAVGHIKIKVRFIFSSSQNDPEKDPYLLSYSLKKVVVEYNVAAREKHHFEYLYNEKNALVFAYHNIDGSDGKFEYRYYYDKNHLIKVIALENPFKNNPEEKLIKRQALNNFNRKDKTDADVIKKKAQNYLAFFQNLKNLGEIK
ncbi:MAG: hypothetical protein GY714_17450 [Desulfobacterales bacterium]|nr:hypothetical protein [Desulfobacterales bacterium]